MKKVFLFMMTATVILIGCQKEGVYNPKKKISRIFLEWAGNTNGKKLLETWTWDGKLLSRIQYYYDGGGIMSFEYDGKRLKCMRNSSGSRYEFVYDGSKVKECNCYYDGKLSATYAFKHDGSKISKITITGYDNSKDFKDGNKHSLISYLLPGTQFAKNIDSYRLANAEKGKGSYSSTISFEWDGKNISKAMWEGIDGGPLNTATSQFTYDNKSNPYYCSLYEVVSSSEWRCLSKNNITKETYTDSDGDYEEYEYKYTYDGNFPTEQKYYEGDYYSITYFEYE